MILYRHAGNIKAGLFILGIILVIGLLAYNQTLIKELRNDNREIVRLYSNIIANVIQDDSDTNLDFVFENIIQKVKFPLIQTDKNNNIQMWKNLPESINSSEKHLERNKFLKLLDKTIDPIPLIYKDKNKTSPPIKFVLMDIFYRMLFLNFRTNIKRKILQYKGDPYL